MLTQISIFTENRKGAMRRLLACLAAADINIVASVTNDSGEYGSIRMLVDQPEKAHEVLTEAGYLCRMTSVLAVELPDRPGSLAGLTEVLDYMNINMDYIYLSYNRASASPVLILHTEYMQEVEESLLGRGYTLLNNPITGGESA